MVVPRAVSALEQSRRRPANAPEFGGTARHPAFDSVPIKLYFGF